VYGSIHGCVDFLLVDRMVFMSFSSYFRWIFVRALFLRFRGVWVRICWWGSWIDALCIFVLDHDPLISGFGLRLKDFGWNPSFLVELGCDSIPDDLVRLRSQVLGYSISWGRFSSPPNLTSRAQAVWEIHGQIGEVACSFSS
jgi:hypothetical protein